ncbi:MAG TPA: DUF1853 family protein [Oxalicibacterium sp.]
MKAPADSAARPAANFQEEFHRRWSHLRDPQVRSLAWLLDAPGLLDASDERWQGRIATLEGIANTEIAAWLHRLDNEPQALHVHLDVRPFSRLGRHAEKLMSFYLLHRGILVAHGVQVRDGNTTIGEFDFLLRLNAQLVHWEFATKFYLLESTGAGADADYFVGPNLADTLGAKMHKIFDRQLQLSICPAAQAVLPEPVALAQALVKGWLFYPDGDAGSSHMYGTSPSHCRGFWCALSEMENHSGERYAILPRLQWLAPARLPWHETMAKSALLTHLSAHFAHDTMPVMVARMMEYGDCAIEAERGFIVPDDWRTRAGQRVQLGRPEK